MRIKFTKNIKIALISVLLALIIITLLWLQGRPRSNGPQVSSAFPPMPPSIVDNPLASATNAPTAPTFSPTKTKTRAPASTQSETNSPSQPPEEGSTTDEPGSGANPSDGETPSEPPSPPEESPSAFVAFYSDNQSDTDEEDARHQAVVNRIVSSGANPIFHAGDLMEDGTQNSLDRFNAVAGSMASSRSFYGALGNNDRKIGDASTPSPLYLANFSFPGNERWYSVNIGNLHMVVLDSAFASGSAEQLAWLESDLQSSASRDRITGVIFHHPTFASNIQPYLNNNAVDFVIDGHTHTYAKSSSNGVYYFTLPGGASLGHALARIYSNQISLTFYNNNGGVIDTQAVANR